MGVSLFTRGPGGLLPTATSLTLVPYAEAMEASAAAFARAASADAQSDAGTIRITCSNVYGVEILPPILAELRRLHPLIEIELAPTDRTEDLMKREADIAVRMTSPKQGALIAKQIPAARLGLFASGDFMAGRSLPIDYRDFAENLPFVGSDRDVAVAKGLEQLELPFPSRCIYRTDSILAQIAAIRAGIGVGICNVQIAEASGLIRLLPNLAPQLESWVCMHEDMKRMRRVRTAFDHLVKSLSLH